MTHLVLQPGGLKKILGHVSPMDMPGEVLMVEPTYFSVDYVINPHMEGNIGKVDKKKARQQWEDVRDAFTNTGLKLNVIEAQPDLPDMVFSANQSLPFISKRGNREVIMSIMHSENRKGEVPYFEQWYRQHGFLVHHLDHRSTESFEGMGDAIWHPGKRLLWGGFGYRTSKNAYEQISSRFNVPVVILELKHPSFYHLDTCFCPLNEQTVMIYPDAFTDDSLKMIREGFETVIEADQHEAEDLFCCNACCPDGKTVIIHPGAENVNARMDEAGFKIVETDTGEFLKSGGSVFCMKLLHW